MTTAQEISLQSTNTVEKQLKSATEGCIARGMARSYGDSALASSVVNTHYIDHFLAFDTDKGVISCEAGVTLSDILKIIVPQGWFLPVTPGTQHVSLGGAIASDVHGKNHHLEGCFSEFVQHFDLYTPLYGVIQVSRENHRELFLATCGGMGLTGIILSATLQLKKIESSWIDQTTTQCPNLETAFAVFNEQKDAPYSVAWIDCCAKGKRLGRSLVMTGAHRKESSAPASRFIPGHKPYFTVPFQLPSYVLNPISIGLFNTFYYHKASSTAKTQRVHYQPFFYPLDGIAHWNRIYGKNGFLQYQFVLPIETGLKGMEDLLSRIAATGRGSFLAVLKAFGPANDNYLSFPIEGFTLALDFKFSPDLLPFLEELDQRVLQYGGRIYLTKDARMSECVFKQSYTNWEKFQNIRAQYGCDQTFASLQSKRLGLSTK